MLVQTCSFRYPAASSQPLKGPDLTVLQVSSSAAKITSSTAILTNLNTVCQSLAGITR